MKGKGYTAVGIALAVAAFLALNVFANSTLTRLRLDLTEQRLFTLSDGTRNLLRGLEDPVTLRLYVSRSLAARLPTMAGYVARVRDLLEEYAHAADGKLVLSVIDPEPFSEEEDRAVGYGLTGIPLRDGESTFYFGLVGTNVLDDREVVPYLSPEREEFLEYDVTKMIHTLGRASRPVIGLLSTLPLEGRQSQQAMMAGRPPQPWLVLERIEELFEVRRLTAADLVRVEDDVDVLMVVHPKGFSDAARYAIDQFVLGGGRALVFVDPNAEADMVPSVPGLPPVPGKSELADLLAAWGLELDTGRTVGDLQLGADVQARVGERVMNIKYPVWLNVPGAQFDRDDVVTARLGNLTFGTAGALAPRADADGAPAVTPLVSTTAEGAGLMDTGLAGPAADLEALLRDFRPDGSAYVLAARIGGTAGTAFPDGAPAAPEGAAAADPVPAHLGEGEVNLIVVADTDLLQDRFWVQQQEVFGYSLAIPIAANASFVINALDNLTGSEDLIGIRSRGRFLRPFTTVNELRQDAELRFRAKEEELLERLEETEKRLGELRTGEGGQAVLTAAQSAAIAEFTNERLRIRRELRDVRHSLRKDIESLETGLKLANIGLVPVVIGLVGLLAGLHRLRRRRTTAVAARPAAAG